jgi:acetylglutamate kinase
VTGVRVIKVGGAALTDAGWVDSLAMAVAGSTTPLVVVHGGGPEITALSAKLGIDVSWSRGRRVTSPEALDVASMVLNGRVNKRLVSALAGAGVDALGVSGEDARLIEATVLDGGIAGRVGAVSAVRAELLAWMLERGVVPVISPISRGPDGSALNVNADEVAAAVAVAVGAVELVFLTDVEGVRVQGNTAPVLSASATADLIATEQATAGMAVKLGAALDALDRGVPAVRIGRFEVLTKETAGTRIRRESEVLACS